MSYKTMIIVVSNRNINEGRTDHQLFGEEPNTKGIDEIRLATATYDEISQEWHLALRQEQQLDEDRARSSIVDSSRPSQQLFTEVMEDIKVGKRKKNWVFYIHGFNQSMLDTLNACREIQTLYEVDVLTFTWPSNPGGFVTREYQQARQAARASSNALDRTLELLGRYLSNRSLEDMRNCRISFNLLVHSLGNYVFENFVRDPIFSDETRIFDNVIFHQADVDNRSHTQWVDRVEHSRRVYITLNEGDSVLKASDIINPGRLGNTLEGLNAKRAIYLDFTNGENVDRSHNFFNSQIENSTIQTIFTRLLNGQRGETVPGLTFDLSLNAFRL
ncbi:alpha/beta hydrolase [Acaryochloris sp. IP29b_bin.137]|uniref:alpha/beta hydrolase n=1 Tax=Acaryochloris sp. IP29b_bin.137 TaxID=2969217 RepID=UPI00262F1A90|nr:alpha/beta hydrolase [Acaryochloris sp. IP29b_bin.137]